MAATPYILLQGLVEHVVENDIKDVTVLQLHTERSEMLVDKSVEGRIRNRCYFASNATREAINSGRADYVPIFLSEIPKMFRRGEQPVDVAVIQVSPPDAHGVCSLGVSVEATLAAISVAKFIIAQVNPNMPRTHGDGFIAIRDIDVIFECESEIPDHPPAELDDITLKIGENIASVIRDGDCLQMGIGAIPDAALNYLNNHKDLGIHTEMFSDGVLPLIENGVINCAKKKQHAHQIVSGFVIGTRKLYDFVHDNPMVELVDIEYVNDTGVIAKHDNMVSINSALQIDLSGQICADSMGSTIYSGVGGQMDFVRGASLSKGGRGIIALPATARNGTVSRISCLLNPGAGVVTTRAHAHLIATEYGLADLRGKSIRERVAALINIAAPQFRESLAKEAREHWRVMVNV
jgi:acyl-CoA hydrolase